MQNYDMYGFVCVNVSRSGPEAVTGFYSKRKEAERQVKKMRALGYPWAVYEARLQITGY